MQKLVRLVVFQSSIFLFAMADPGEGPGGPGPPPPLFFDQTETRRIEKMYLESGPARYLAVWMTAHPPSQGLDPIPCLYRLI